MPRPPPPATALINTGKPTAWAKRERFLLRRGPRRRCRARPARSASRASSRAAFLSPSRAIACGLGPMKSMLQLRQISLKWAFSARKP